MKFNLGEFFNNELREKAESAIQSSIAKLGVGMKKLVEDDKTFSEVVDLAYEALPLPVRLGLRKESFRKLAISIKDKYTAESSSATKFGADQLPLPIGEGEEQARSSAVDNSESDPSANSKDGWPT